MKILIFGAGGREHALAWAVGRSARVTEVVCAPGNGGMAQVARCVAADLKSVDDMLRVAEAEQPGLTIVGPEVPLALGLVDAMQARQNTSGGQARGMRVFGPTQAAAQLESSKAFAKHFMQRHRIPTANYAVCDKAAELEAAIGLFHAPIVVKADGLAAGKGVLICESRAKALEAAHGLFDGSLLGEAAQQVVIEEFLDGDEVSFLCLSDGTHVAPLKPAQDHKRIGEGDTGPNTGGMGVYSTDDLLAPEMAEWIVREIAEPTVRGMAEEGAPFVGVLYCGLMMTARGPQVLEYNARFGDPETQAILPRLKSDLVDALEACIDGTLDQTPLAWTPDAAACVVASSAGYPGGYQTGFPITGLGAAAQVPQGQVPTVQVFHSGTARVGSHLVTNGGRVLGVSALGGSLPEALTRAYEAMGKIEFEGMYYRHDIGHRALARKA
ncbi:MAG TPA: phosphoribosylamine--glycine ligase [Terracidiphilus sp.]|jgi:phosphoribosylamine--glycine ligase|nr:phosphoribosylamine--glycine ligase [Terracidiphilus sp.]